MTASNQTVALVCPKYYYAAGVLVVYPGDSACTQTKIGEYCDLVSNTSGAQTLNGTVNATGQFFILGFDPENNGTTTDYVVTVAEPQNFGFAQS